MKMFSEILYNLLKQRGLSQKELADQANTTEATISRYLSSNRTPRVDLVVSIAKAFNVSTDFLLGLTEVPNSKYLAAETDTLVARYNMATESDRKVIWTLLEKYQDSDIRIAAHGQDVWYDEDAAKRKKAVKEFGD